MEKVSLFHFGDLSSVAHPAGKGTRVPPLPPKGQPHLGGRRTPRGDPQAQCEGAPSLCPSLFSLPGAVPAPVPPCPAPEGLSPLPGDTQTSAETRRGHPSDASGQPQPAPRRGSRGALPPSPLLAIAEASSREKLLFSLMGYRSPDSECTQALHTQTHRSCVRRYPNPCTSHWELFGLPSPHQPPSPESLWFLYPSMSEITAGIKRHRNQENSYLKVINFLSPH